MKIAVFGATLQAAVMSALFAERGHQVTWCPQQDSTTFQLQHFNFDVNVIKLLESQQNSGFLKFSHLSDSIQHQHDAYFFCF